MAIFQFAYVIETQMGLTNAVREAARRAAATEDETPTWLGGAGTVQGFVRAELCGDLAGDCDGGLLDENVPAYNKDRLATDPPNVSVCKYTVTKPDSTTITNYQIDVSITYGHPLFFSMLAFATDAIDGNPNGDWDMSVSAEMRMEFADDTVAGFDPVITICPT